MSVQLSQTITLCEQMIQNCDIDYKLLTNANLHESYFDDYNNTRVVNSFLFTYSKLQDKIGSKLFKQLLYELQEIDSFDIPMIDILNTLERLNLITKSQWDRLREIRNLLAHEYPFSPQERVENIKVTLDSYITLKNIFQKIADAAKQL